MRVDTQAAAHATARRTWRCEVAATFVAVLAASCAMGRVHSVTIGLTHVSYVTRGSAGPVVVFESGMGDGFLSWNPVFDGVAATTTVAAYSRPGYAGGFFRREADGERTADDVARTLRTMLTREAVPAPYVLVGHSVGGSYALRFAKLYPEDVAGIVLVDARLKEFRPRCEAAGLSLCSPPEVVGHALKDHVREELRGLEASEAEMPEPEDLGEIPITVIAATKPPSYAPAGLQELWLEVQQGFARRVANGRYVQAEGAGHYVHRDDPELVIGEISELVERIRRDR